MPDRILENAGIIRYPRKGFTGVLVVYYKYVGFDRASNSQYVYVQRRDFSSQLLNTVRVSTKTFRKLEYKLSYVVKTSVKTCTRPTVRESEREGERERERAKGLS